MKPNTYLHRHGEEEYIVLDNYAGRKCYGKCYGKCDGKVCDKTCPVEELKKAYYQEFEPSKK